MTDKQLEACKTDLLKTYQAQLCDESIDAITKAKTPDEFVRIVHQFDTFLRYKALPSADWCRKWFGAEKYLLNRNGVYLDQIFSLNDPDEHKLVFIGRCHVTLTCSEPCLYNVSLQDESDLNLLAYGVTSVTVREKGTGKTKILFCNPHSHIKIHKI